MKILISRQINLLVYKVFNWHGIYLTIEELFAEGVSGV